MALHSNCTHTKPHKSRAQCAHDLMWTHLSPLWCPSEAALIDRYDRYDQGK